MAESELSREELKAAKEKWRVKSKVEIYSSSRGKWFKGQITRIFEDEEGEWLVIKYGANNEKEIQRYSQGIRPILKSVKSKRKKKKETKPTTKRKASSGDKLKVSDSNNLSMRSPDEPSPESAIATTPDVAAEAKRGMKESINDRLKAIGMKPSKQSMAEKAMKAMMEELEVAEKERLKKAEEERLRFIEEEEERRKQSESETVRIDPDEEEEATDNITWCLCVGALYDEDTLKCTVCGKHWFVPEIDPRSADELEHELETLYKKKGQRILARIGGRSEFEKATEEEQAVIIQLISMLLEMRRVAQALYELILGEEVWAENLMRIYQREVAQ